MKIRSGFVFLDRVLCPCTYWYKSYPTRRVRTEEAARGRGRKGRRKRRWEGRAEGLHDSILFMSRSEVVAPFPQAPVNPLPTTFSFHSIIIPSDFILPHTIPALGRIPDPPEPLV